MRCLLLRETKFRHKSYAYYIYHKYLSIPIMHQGTYRRGRIYCFLFWRLSDMWIAQSLVSYYCYLSKQFPLLLSSLSHHFHFICISWILFFYCLLLKDLILKCQHLKSVDINSVRHNVTTKMYFLTVLEARSSRSRCHQVGFLLILSPRLVDHSLFVYFLNLFFMQEHSCIDVRPIFRAKFLIYFFYDPISKHNHILKQELAIS